jgi:putative membrane protein
MLLKETDHVRVRQAVEEAEVRTSGEIICVVARECGEYFETPLAWGIAVALLVPIAALLIGLRPDMIEVVTGGWIAANTGGAEAAVGRALITYAVLQALLFVLTVVIVSFGPIRRLLTPRALKREHVHRRAMEQFAARAYHLTEEDTGVLIFASLAERQAVVLADDGVASKVDAAAWSKVVDELVAGMQAKDAGGGFARAIASAADILAAHCPPKPDNRNQLPDTVIELDF